MNYIVVGATGLVGEDLIFLLENQQANFATISRRKLSTPLKNGKSIISDFKDIAAIWNLLPFSIADSVLCVALGTTIKKAGSQENFRAVDYSLVLDFAKTYTERGGQNISVVSAVGANPKSANFYSRIKGETEEGLQKLPLKSLMILRPSLLLGNRKEERSVEKLFIQLSPIYSFLTPLKYRPVPSRRVAQALLATGAQAGVHILENKDLITKDF